MKTFEFKVFVDNPITRLSLGRRDFVLKKGRITLPDDDTEGQLLLTDAGATEVQPKRKEVSRNGS